MITAEIIDKTTKRIVATTEIPQIAKEIKYSAFLEFSFKADAIFNWIREQEDLGKKYDAQYLMKVCDTVASVLNVDPNILKNLKYKEQDWIWDAWYSIHKIIKDFVPDENGGEFVLNGKKYKVPAITKSLVRGEAYTDDLIMQQVSEIARVEKDLGDVLFALSEREQKEKGFNKEGDVINSHFAYSLMKIAICLADPDTIPVDATFDRWLDDRVEELQDISMVDALNTIFFLTGMPKGSGMIIALDGILKAYQLENDIKKMEKTIKIE